MSNLIKKDRYGYFKISNFFFESISKIVENFHSEIPKQKENSSLFWDSVERKLSLLLRTAADFAFEKKLIKKVTRDKYFVSSKAFLFKAY